MLIPKITANPSADPAEKPMNYFYWSPISILGGRAKLGNF
jgi:hypothetical protein